MLSLSLSVLCSTLAHISRGVHHHHHPRHGRFDDVSQEILPLAQEYLHLVRGAHRVDDGRMSKLLETTISKMRYDDEFNFDDQVCLHGLAELHVAQCVTAWL